jgi:hypothetical protein
MKNSKQIKKWSTFLAVLFAMWSCEIIEDNNPPTADAGGNFELEVGETATLDGSNSSDPDGDELTFTWEFTSTPNGSTVNISNADSPTATFIPDVAGEFAITLTVEDPMGGQGTADVVVTAIANEPPVAVITDASGQAISSENGNNEINIDNVLQLHGTQSTDPEDDELSYSWELISGPSGGSVNLENVNTSILSFSADFAGEYTIGLTVDDGKGNTNSTEVVITVLESANEPPSAVITDGSGQSISSENGNNEIVLGNSMQLSGVESSDPEGDELTFSWTVSNSPDGSNPVLENENSEVLTFTPDMEGEYDIALTVDDGEGNTNSAEATISVIPNQPPVAVITDENGQSIEPANNNNVISAGNMVQFYGDQSTDPEDDELTYSWAVASAPTGSTPTLENENTAVLGFSADAGGDYVITLTVNDGQGNEDTAEITITAEVSPVIIDADILSNRTLENIYNDSNLPDYHITRSITVEALLTIEAGVKIILDEDVNVQIASAGTIISNGEESNHVEFTSSNIDGQILWKGIQILSTSSQNAFSYTDFSYAGRSVYGGFSNFVDVKSTIAVHDDGKFSMTNSSISNSGGYGIYMRYGEFVNFSSNDFSDNTLSGIGVNLNQAVKIDGASTFTSNQHPVEIYGSTFDAAGEPSLASLDNSNKYYVSGDLEITTFLNVDEGAKFEMEEDVNIKISTGGVLKAVGTENAKIEFTTANLNAGLLWKGIEFISGDSRNELTHCIISYAGNSEYGAFSNFVDVEASIAMHGDTRLSLSNTEISNSGGYGLYSRYGEFVNFSSNNFVDNSYDHLGLPANEVGKVDEATTFSGGDEYAVEVYNGGDLSVESTWVNLAGDARYNIVEQITVVAGLTINPGAEIDLDEDVDIDVRDSGFLVAEGTAEESILFTSSNEPGQIAWGGIKFYTADARNSLDFVTINLAGGNVTTDLDDFVDEKTAVAGNNNARLSLTNSTISNSEGYGVYFQGNINDIESAAANNTFTNNPEGNVYTP